MIAVISPSQVDNFDPSILTLVQRDTYDVTGVIGQKIILQIPLASAPTGYATATWYLTLPGYTSAILLPTPVTNLSDATLTFTFGLSSTITGVIRSGAYSIICQSVGGVDTVSYEQPLVVLPVAS